MKRVKFLAMMLAAGMFAACSDTLEDTGGGNAGGNTATTGDGYVKVAINMPTTSGTASRADDEENDQFDNGTTDEYAVGDDNWIIFFNQSGTEAEASVLSATKLDGLNFGAANTGTPNVTTTSTAIIDEVPTNTTHALVILNANGMISYSGTDGLQVNKGAKIDKFSGLLSALSNQEVNKWISSSEKSSFVMTNAPIATDATPTAVTTLAKINVYSEERLAQTAAPDPIYVERAVAKVTISAFPTKIDLTNIDDDNPLNGATVKLTGWTLDNTNSSVKLVRDVTGSGTNGWSSWTSIENTASSPAVTANRFFGTTELPYRVYWAIDGNYSATSTEGITSVTTFDNWNTSIATGSSPNTTPVAAYCFENTFPMSTNAAGTLVSEAVATRVLFQMQVTPKIKEDGTVAGAEDQTATDFILFGGTSAVYTKTTFLNYVKEFILPETEVTLNTSLTNGKVFTEASQLYGTDGLFSSGVSESNAADVLEKLGGEVRFYKDNVMYTEAAYIKHFGEYYTPLKTEALGANESYLGRYGVVRNNWYELNVTKVGIGSPVIPDDGGNLDEDEAYMNVVINILSWAKRTQSVEL